MRTLLMLAVLVGAVLVGGWIGGETLLARSVREAIARDPRIEAAGVTQLREPGRIGVRIARPVAETPQGRAAMDWLDVFVPPGSLTEVHVAAAPGAQLAAAGRVLTLGGTGAEAWAGFSPTHDLALSHARVVTHDVAVDGAPAVAGLDLDARLGGFGADAPRAAGAAYDIDGEARGVMLAALTGGAVEGEAAAEGRGRVWLDRVPVRGGAIAGMGARLTAPQLVGLRLDGVVVTLDDLAARLWGRVVADAEGLATGELLIDTADARGFVARAADLGLLPRAAVPVAATVLTGLAAPAPSPAAGAGEDRSGSPSAFVEQAPAAEAEADAEPATSPAGPGAVLAPGGIAAPDLTRPDPNAPLPEVLIPAWPAPEAGQSRLVVTFRDGKAMLGPLTLGPAPRLRR